jgi:hypothetical protein
MEVLGLLKPPNFKKNNEVLYERDFVKLLELCS